MEESFIPSRYGFIFSIHPRFVEIPEHRHLYLELIYCYSGSVEQEIGGQRTILEKGDVCFLDTMTSHALGRAGQNDLAVNCLVRRSYLEASILSRLAPGSSLTEFILGTSFTGSARGGFRILKTGDDPALREAICRALREQYDPGPYSSVILESCLCLIFAELARFADAGSFAAQGSVGMIPEILKYIEEHCANLRLPVAVARFGMKPGTFASFLSRNLGRTFLDLVHDARLSRAVGLLSGTDASIEEIANEAGYANIGFFYRLFKARYGVTPAVFRSGATTHPMDGPNAG